MSTSPIRREEIKKMRNHVLREVDCKVLQWQRFIVLCEYALALEQACTTVADTLESYKDDAWELVEEPLILLRKALAQ